MAMTTFGRTYSRMCVGPIIWAIHFAVIYGFTGVLCARPGLQSGQSWLGLGIIAWGVLAASVVAIIVILIFNVSDWRGAVGRSNTAFMHGVAAWLGLLSIVAILWGAATVLLVPACA